MAESGAAGWSRRGRGGDGGARRSSGAGTRNQGGRGNQAGRGMAITIVACVRRDLVLSKPNSATCGCTQFGWKGMHPPRACRAFLRIEIVNNIPNLKITRSVPVKITRFPISFLR